METVFRLADTDWALCAPVHSAFCGAASLSPPENRGRYADSVCGACGGVRADRMCAAPCVGLRPLAVCQGQHGFFCEPDFLLPVVFVRRNRFVAEKAVCVLLRSERSVYHHVHQQRDCHKAAYGQKRRAAIPGLYAADSASGGRGVPARFVFRPQAALPNHGGQLYEQGEHLHIHAVHRFVRGAVQRPALFRLHQSL